MYIVFCGGSCMLQKIKHALTLACILFTAAVFLLYAVGLALVGATIMFTLEALVLLFALCVLIALCSRILHIESLSIPIRILIHYVLILASAFSVFAFIGGFVQSAASALIAFVCVTLVYAVFAVIFAALEQKKTPQCPGSKKLSKYFQKQIIYKNKDVKRHTF